MHTCLYDAVEFHLNLHVGHLRSSPEPIQSEDRAISLAASARNRLKGMRRRAAKLLTRIKADSFDYQTDICEAAGSRQAAEALSALQKMAKQVQRSLTDGDITGESLIRKTLPNQAKRYS